MREWLILSVVVLGCSPLEDDNKNRCVADQDCLDGRICHNGTCVTPECQKDDACDVNEVCRSGVCERVTCEPDSCSTHGSCEVSGRAISCVCDAGYSGDRCETCADGYQDRDGDTVCLPACTSQTCGDHGTCNDRTGVIDCECDTGWTGSGCDSCANGYHDEGGNCVQDQGCLPTSCSGHGTCTTPGGVVSCACYTGYDGDHCEICAVGYQDYDNDGTCEPDSNLIDPNAAWRHFGRDDQHTSHNPDEQSINTTNVNALVFKWGLGCNGGAYNIIHQAPVLHNSRLYVSSVAAKLQALNALTGLQLMEHDEGSAQPTGYVPQPFVTADGKVYYLEGSNPTNLYALDADLEPLWTAEVGFELGFNASVVLAVDETNDRIYLIEPPFIGGGKLFAVDRATGFVSWYLGPNVSSHEFCGSYPVLHAGQVYSCARDAQQSFPPDEIAVVEPSSQQVIERYQRPTAVDTDFDDVTDFSICNGKLIATFSDLNSAIHESTLVAWDLTNGAELWIQTYSSRIAKVSCNPTSDTIFVPTDPYLYALDAANGNERWRYQGLSKILAPSVANGVVYFHSATNIYAVEESSGSRLFQHPLGHEAGETTQVAVAGGMLFFSGNGGSCDLFALGLP